MLFVFHVKQGNNTIRVDSFAAYAYSNKCDNLFVCIAFRLRVWVGVKSTARSSVPSYFIGYFDAVNSDYFSQRRQLPCSNTCKRIAFFHAAKNANISSLNAINR